MPALDILVDVSALGILDLGIDDILGLDILVGMPTSDIPAGVLADFPFFDMPALDIDLSALGILDFEIGYLQALDILGFGDDDILGLDILDYVSTFDISADLADISIHDMPALDILVDLSTPGILDF